MYCLSSCAKTVLVATPAFASKDTPLGPTGNAKTLTNAPDSPGRYGESPLVHLLLFINPWWRNRFALQTRNASTPQDPTGANARTGSVKDQIPALVLVSKL